MYPVLFKVGTFEVTTFGAMVALGTFVGLWLFTRELQRSRLPEGAVDGALLGVIAGFLGAKLLFVLEHLRDESFVSLLSSRGGLSWFGGLFGGIGTALAYFRWKRWAIVPIVAAATPALAIGHLLGRVGCFLVGDDYGRPTTLPWGVAFPKGLPPTDVPVHPTQLYEGAFLAGLAWLLIGWRRAHVASRIVLGRYLVLAGSARFLIEFLRVMQVAFGLTVAQYGALTIAVVGAILIGEPRLIGGPRQEAARLNP